METVSVEPATRADVGAIVADLDARWQFATVQRDVAGVHCEGVSGLDLRDVTVEWEDDSGVLPAYYSHGLQCVDVADVDVRGFEGRQAHRDGEEAAVALREVETVSVRDSRASPGTGRFLESEGVRDARLFTGNDLADADSVGLDPEAGFMLSGNLEPS